jgi:hypothetical protein
MGIFDMFQIQSRRAQDLCCLEGLIRGSAYPRGISPQRTEAMTMTEVLNPRSAFESMKPPRNGLSAMFSDMADPKAVEHFLLVIREDSQTRRNR